MSQSLSILQKSFIDGRLGSEHPPEESLRASSLFRGGGSKPPVFGGHQPNDC